MHEELVVEAGRDEAGFESFVAEATVPLRRALVARYGVEIGNDACRDALGYAWERWDEVSASTNPRGLLYRVGQSAARKYFRWRRTPNFPPELSAGSGTFEPGLERALVKLSPAQRVAVVLVHGYRYSYQEAADVIGVPVTTIRNHVHRGLVQLRRELEG